MKYLLADFLAYLASLTLQNTPAYADSHLLYAH
jgi:hypothetical protein